MKTKLHYVLSLTIFLFVFSINAQDNQRFWFKISKQKATQGKQLIRKTEPKKASYYQLDIEKLKALLNTAPKRNINKVTSKIIVDFPNSNGEFDVFRIKEASILEPAFQTKNPGIKTYIGQSIKNPSTLIRFSLTPSGLHSMELSSTNGTQFIDPYTQTNNNYIVYNKGDLPALKKEFECYLPEELTVAEKTNTNAKSFVNANDGKLRTFRLALASTIEYSSFHWMAAGLTAADTEADKKAAVLAAMVVTMNRVNGIFERDLSLTMSLVDNSSIIFIDSDNFTNDDANDLINESQSVINAAILPANYDIGHTLSTGGGGLASLNSPCDNNRKASGITGSSVPVGDAYDIDFVAHEMGHQFGAPHTFNGNAGSCADNRTASNAYEPGSGTTIMAYAGICAPENVENSADAYFHQKSLQMMWDNITTGISTCASETLTGNNAPVANAGADYTIPISTPYRLTGASTDIDGTGTHTYTWEQYDLGASGIPIETNTTGPLIRSFEGTTNPIRSIPEFTDYISTGGSTTWEKLASVNRTINFALTVRDNDISGGQTDVDFMQITVDSTDPFTVTNPISWSQGSNVTIEWVVGQTANVSTINCQNVNIKLSIDGGLTFPNTIASNVPNTGSYVYAVPAMADTTTARILIEAADNIFYDVSNFDFSISTNADFFMVEETLDPIACKETTATFHFNYVPTNSFSETTTFSASGNPSGSSVTFSPTSMSASGNVTMTISNLDGVSQGDYPITITGTSTSLTKNKVIDFPFYNSICPSVANTDYNTSTTLVQFNTINNSSAKPSGYSDYTSISTNMNRSSSYDLTVNVNTDGDFTATTMVWIDWNQDCEFDDVGETYNLGDATNVANGITSNSALSITVPNNAIVGNTTMRISTKYKDDGAPTSCENSFDGEVEDYTINIIGDLQSQITLVQFNTINNASAIPTNYSDYTSISTDIKRDSSYPLSVNIDTNGNFEASTKAWIDWNQDSTFDDSEEVYNLGLTTNVNNGATTNSPLTIIVPTTALLGNTVMRVSTKNNDGGLHSPTENIANGEVEDYTLNITPSLSVETYGFDNFVVFPNPNNGRFTLKLNSNLSSDVKVDIYDLRGRNIYTNMYNDVGDLKEPIILNHVQSGVYILHARDDKRDAIKKIVIK